MNPTSPKNKQLLRHVPPTGAPMFLWMIVGVMAAIELVLSLSSSGIIGTDNLRWPAFMFGAFWELVLSGALPPV
jgi:hypothetical protein